MTLEDYVSWIQSGQTKQAYTGLLKLYEQTKDLHALFYITLIDMELSFGDKKEEIGKNFKTIFDGGKKFRLLSYEAYFAYLIDTQSFEDMERVLKFAKKDNYHTYLSSLARAMFLCMYKNEYSPHLKEAITDAMNFPESQNDINNLNMMLIDYYINNEEVENAKECLNKFAITHPGNPVINLLGLKISLIENYPNFDNYYYDEVMDGPFKDRGLLTIGEHYYSKKDYSKALEYLEKVGGETLNSKGGYPLILESYAQSKEYLKGIEYFKKQDTNIPVIKAYLGSLYSLLDDNKSLDIAISYFQEARKGLGIPYIERDLSHLYILKNDYVSLEESIKTMQKTLPDDSGTYYYSIFYNLSKGNFKEALNLYRKIKDEDFKSQAFSIFSMFGTRKEAKKEFYRLLKNKNLDSNDCVRAYYYGLYGLKPNYEKVKEILDDDYEKTIYSILNESENDEFKCLDQAKEFYLINKEKDNHETTFVDLYLWLLIKHKDYDQAKSVLDDYPKEYLSIWNENILCAMGELALHGYLDMKDTYEKIMNNIHDLYSVGLYKTIVKMDEKLGISSSSHKKMLKNSIKNSSYKEKKYYKNHDEFLLMM